MHVGVALDQLGRCLGSHAIPTTPSGYAALLAWARHLGTLERIGIEGTSSDGGPARFVWCPRCERAWVQAGGGQNPVVSRHARLLAREILRLKAQLAAAPDGGDGTTSPAS